MNFYRWYIFFAMVRDKEVVFIFSLIFNSDTSNFGIFKEDWVAGSCSGLQRGWKSIGDMCYVITIINKHNRTSNLPVNLFSSSRNYFSKIILTGVSPSNPGRVASLTFLLKMAADFSTSSCITPFRTLYAIFWLFPHWTLYQATPEKAKHNPLCLNILYNMGATYLRQILFKKNLYRILRQRG